MDSHDFSNSGVNSEPAPPCKNKGKKKGSSGRKSTKWGRHEHLAFISCCADAIAAGHREGKCFTTTGWELIVAWLNERTGQEWTQPALLTHWKAMRKDHTQFFELLNCSGVTYDHKINAIVAP